MAATTAEDTRTLALGEVSLELAERGEGRPLLFLHGGHPSFCTNTSDPIVERLAESFRVLVPTHPGFGHVDAPGWMNSVDDLAYLYLDLLEALDVRDVVLVGVSLGGWIATEMACKATARLSRLVLANPLGIRIGDRESRDFVDIYGILDSELAERAFADPAHNAPKAAGASEDTLYFMARAREATARYAWSPYLHNPKLIRRLHRVDIPTLILWGEADRIVLAPGYAKAYAGAIPGARFAALPGAGHFAHLEQPDALARHILAFVEGKDAELVS